LARASQRKGIGCCDFDGFIAALLRPHPGSPVQNKAGKFLSARCEELYRKGVLDPDAKSPREEFKRVRNSLRPRGLIAVSGELVWKA
jgi:hypothetical protein